MTNLLHGQVEEGEVISDGNHRLGALAAHGGSETSVELDNDEFLEHLLDLTLGGLLESAVGSDLHEEGDGVNDARSESANISVIPGVGYWDTYGIGGELLNLVPDNTLGGLGGEELGKEALEAIELLINDAGLDLGEVPCDPQLVQLGGQAHLGIPLCQLLELPGGRPVVPVHLEGRGQRL